MLKDEEIKKGAGYLEELAGRLWRERIHTLPVQDGLLTVTLDDRPVGAVAENGDIYQRRSDLDTPEAKVLYFRVLDISREVSEYRKEMERAPVLKAEGLTEPYRLLAALEMGTFFIFSFSKLRPFRKQWKPPRRSVRKYLKNAYLDGRADNPP